MGGPGSGRQPREYPAGIVELVRYLYCTKGMKIAEVQAAIPRGFKAQNIIRRYDIPARPRGWRTDGWKGGSQTGSTFPVWELERDQTGPLNPGWKGDAAGYKALHLRVYTARGRPSLCERCGATEGRFEWANLSGNYADVWDYQRMCVRCHRAFDFKGRRPNGQLVRVDEVITDD